MKRKTTPKRTAKRAKPKCKKPPAKRAAPKKSPKKARKLKRSSPPSKTSSRALKTTPPALTVSQSAKRLQAIELLAHGNSAREVAAALKISRETIAQWKQQEDFTTAVQIKTDEITDEIRGQFFSLQEDAVQCLKRQMEKGGAAGVRAAIAVLQVSGVMSTPRIPPRLMDLFKGKVLDVRFVDPADLADTAGGACASESARNA